MGNKRRNLKIEYNNAIEIITEAFKEMKNIYSNNIEDYVNLPYAFYESEFVPFIMLKLKQNDLVILNEIFNFIEKLFLSGDDMIVNLVEVAVVESLFFEKNYTKYESAILNLCGKQTRHSFEKCCEKP